ncbi:hypothetical protein GGX14DRAFT_540754 [Mycena pura]|uniref:Uncharacterized protein n=1 Tax=Mycena pura TaxID=153505 RepID=A0AAD6VRL0_9AGAR|nr:hypothetical protein GGX14DRAFT_540754 [Mycena pura]
MFSLAPIVASLLLVSAALATPMARAACNPSLSGSGLSIANGNLEIGYTSSVAGAPLISQTFSLAPEFIGEASTIDNGGFVLKDVNQDNHAPGLFPTFVDGGALELETLATPEDGKQGWGFVCSTCSDFTTAATPIASGCTIRSGWTGQCLQIGSAAGDLVTLATCTGLGSGPQYFDIYV